MLPFDTHLLSFIVRWIHVLSMAFLLGGALLIAALSFRGKKDGAEYDNLPVFVALRYEWFF